METSLIQNKDTENIPQKDASTSNTNQTFIPENLDLQLPDDTFRMSLDNFSIIGENITLGGRDTSVDDTPTSIGTPVLTLPTPNIDSPETPLTPPIEKFTRTPEYSEQFADNASKTHKPRNLQLSLVKKDDTEIFVKPSPVSELMSPARMLQFEVDIATSATPTMKRAAIDFDFFNKNNFDEYFDDLPPKAKDEANVNKLNQDTKPFEETPVIVKANTVRHEIGYGVV
ncbi:uncharacterized protein LOC113233681 [Hyposmocoma kahamanoa]|uniref:uncharacterized protein LOC113233681 n=1 Tax=Hyposmocoma kahamanoa TaxID=1477025 RepID=UPI000E6D6C73|nr:uncharacterized protein LOC113233681 [Hyposmocoma kahamanoa]